MSVEIKWVLDEEPALCFREGFRFFVKHVGTRYENPYAAGSTGHSAYLAGWRCGVSSFASAARAVKGVQPPGAPIAAARRLPVIWAH